MIQIELFNRTKSVISRKLFSRLCPRAFQVLVRERAVTRDNKLLIEIALVGNTAIRSLNRKHHNKNKVTDVISLSYFDKTMDDSFIGEIFICLPFARAQAEKIGQTLHAELRFLFVHGLLHIFGYDHKKPREEAVMKKLTYEVLG